MRRAGVTNPVPPSREQFEEIAATGEAVILQDLVGREAAVVNGHLVQSAPQETGQIATTQSQRRRSVARGDVVGAVQGWPVGPHPGFNRQPRGADAESTVTRNLDVRGTVQADGGV